MAPNVLLDTSAIFALLNPEDARHAQAIAINSALMANNASLVLPNFLLAEAHAIINKRLGTLKARDFLNAALQDFEIERVTTEDEWAAHALLQKTSQRMSLSYFDAVSCSLAGRLGINDVFSFDHHFRLMGFNLLKP